MLTFGCLTMVMSILGCYGMAIESKSCSITYFCLQILIILAEIAVGSYWLVRSENLGELIKTRATFGAYSMTRTMQWTQMQMEMNCCGSADAYDYPRQNFSVPKECCISEPSISTYRLLITVFDKPCQAALVQKRGCQVILADTLAEERIIISAFLFGGALIKIVMLVVSFLIPFDELQEEIGWSPVGSLEWNKPKEEAPVVVAAAV